MDTAQAQSLDAKSSPTAFTVEPQSPTIGAFIHGLDLSQALDDATIDALRQALVQWKVIFFRDQNLSTDEHIAFGQRFGELEIHPLTPADQDQPEILRIAHNKDKRGTENFWHSDVTWRPQPSLGSILRAVKLPDVGGDTLWADMEAAYNGLSDEVKEKLEGLQAQHSFLKAFGHLIPAEQHEQVIARHPPQNHPVVRTHPESGRKSIYVNIAFTTHLVDMEPQESKDLLKTLMRTASVPEYQVRLRWQPGTMAFWDNRSSQHYAVSDYWPHTRVMDRVTVVGDTPV
jgi:taurine dioxygenase